MKHKTLLYLLRDGEVLLAKKNKGFGEGKLNGVGGGVHHGESITSAAIREAEEELGVVVVFDELEKRGEVRFVYHDMPASTQTVHVFVARSWSGEPASTAEMSDPAWYPVAALPYERMWADDVHWLPQVLRGQSVEAVFEFRGDLPVLDTFSVKEL